MRHPSTDVLVLRFAIFLQAAAATGYARADAIKPTIVVSYFDNNTGQAAFDPLAKGLADMLITDLLAVDAVQVVERNKLNHVLAELELSHSKFIDPKTALKLGNGVAARYVLAGCYTLAGDVLRIDARVFEVETANVLASEKVEGKMDTFFALEKELVDILMTIIHVKIGPAERARLRINPTQSFPAWAAYSEGLEAHDNGDPGRARAQFEKALAADPNYAAAKNALERLAIMFARADRNTEVYVDAELRALDAKSPAFGQKVEDLLVSLPGTNIQQVLKKTELLTWLGQKKLLACPRTAGPAPEAPWYLINGVPYGGVISHCRQVHEVLLVAYELMRDPTMWDTIPKVCEHFILRLPLDHALISYCKETIIRDVMKAKDAGADAGTVYNAPKMKAMLASYAHW